MFTAGSVDFIPGDADVDNLELDVFKVDYSEIKIDTSNVNYCEIVPDAGDREMIAEEFNQYFPRRTINPNYVVVITWDLYKNTSDVSEQACMHL